MNTETGEIKELNPEEQAQKIVDLESQKVELEKKLQETSEELEDKRKWKAIPIGQEIEISGLKFIVHHARVDTQEVVLKPVGKMKFRNN